MAGWIDALSAALLGFGGFLAVTGALGVLRFPDFYTRLHAAGITDTLCTACFVAALMLQVGPALVAVKLLFILLFVFLTSPTAAHALARAAQHGRLTPRLHGQDEETPPSPR